MGRLPRPTGDDLIYHAINRGNNRADVLGPEGERDMFLGDLARTKARYPFALFGYCLMSNHFHLLLKPAPGQSISRILQSLTGTVKIVGFRGKLGWSKRRNLLRYSPTWKDPYFTDGAAHGRSLGGKAERNHLVSQQGHRIKMGVFHKIGKSRHSD